MSRRLAFARARRPVAVAMRVVAAALAQAGAGTTARRSVFTGPRGARRVAALRDPSAERGLPVPRGCEDLH